MQEIYRKVYQWKYINCLELWTGAICANSSEGDLRPLAYPLSQIISGVARLVPTAQYFPLRLRCVRMLNRIAASTGTLIPVSLLLLDMLEIKELHKPPTGGVGKAVDLRAVLKVFHMLVFLQHFVSSDGIVIDVDSFYELGEQNYLKNPSISGSMCFLCGRRAY